MENLDSEKEIELQWRNRNLKRILELEKQNEIEKAISGTKTMLKTVILKASPLCRSFGLALVAGISGG